MLYIMYVLYLNIKLIVMVWQRMVSRFIADGVGTEQGPYHGGTV